MDVLAITTAGYGGRLCFLDESNLCYAGGHGVVIHDKDTGLQKHIWALPEGLGHPPPNMAPAVFATCPGGHLLAYVQQGGVQQVIQVVQQETLLPASTIKDAGARHVEFAQLVFDTDGTRLASIGGPPDFQLDVWDVDLKESLLRVSLPESLTGLEPAFFPLNSGVLAVAGPDAARLLWDEPLAGTRIVRQSEVDLSVLVEGERLNCLCWTPNGTLLLGTTAGRLLGVKCAAPPAVPTHGWGLHAGSGHVAELLYGATSPSAAPEPPRPLVLPSAPSMGAGFGAGLTPTRAGVAAVIATATHLLLVMAGEANSPAELLWLSPEDLSPIATSELPMSTIVHAVLSPSYEQIAIAAADGAISLCGTACPVSQPPVRSGGSLAGDGSNNNSANSLPALPPAAAPASSFSRAGGKAAAAAAAVAGGQTGAAGGGANVTFAGLLGGDHLAPPPSGSHSGEKAPVVVVKADPVKVTYVARFHRGRLSACLWLNTRRFMTGGMDGSVRMWSYIPNEVEAPDTAEWVSPAILLEATWDVSQPVTVMAALNPPLPSGTEWPTGGGADTYGEADAAYGGAAPKPPAFLIGTAGGVVQLINADRVPANLSDAPDREMMVKSLGATWDVRLFNGPVTAAAFSQDGRFCAVSCAAEAKICFLRVMVLGHELSMRVLGFYPMREPRHLAWAPPEPGSIHPLLVVGTILGEVLVLAIPDSSALEEGPADGVLTRGSLVRATMRAQSHITSLTVYPMPAPETRGGGHFWVITTHTDKSIRRYRLFTDQQKSTAAATARAAAVAAAAGSEGSPGAAAANVSYRAPTPGGADTSYGRTRPGTGQALGRNISMAPGNQNFQMPDSEKPMELQLAATALSISLMPSGGGGGPGPGGGGVYGSPVRMAVASSDGSVALYSMPEIALQGRWLLHEIVAGGATGVCLLGDKLLSVGGEGSVQVLELSNVARGARHATHRGSHGVSPHPAASSPSPVGRVSTAIGAAAQRSAFFSASGPPRPRGMERATLGSLLPVHLQPTLPTTCTAAHVAPSWQEARSQATRELYREQLTTFRAKAQAKCREWVARIKELQKLNEAAEEVEKLLPEEFVIDVGLRAEMVEAGEARYAKAKAQEARRMQIMQFQRQRLKEQGLGIMECSSRPLMALSEYTFISPMDAAEARRYKFEGEAAANRTAAEGGVWSFGLRKMQAAQELRLRQVSFLRKVEQAECASRGSMERGAVVPIRRYKGDMQRRFNLLTEEEQQQQQQQGQQQQGQQQGQGQQGPGGLGLPGLLQGQAGAQQQQGVAPPASLSSMPRQSLINDDYDDYDDDPQSLSRKGARRARDDGFEGTELGYGETGLLYADVQLYTHCRRAAQVVFIQEEVRCLRRLFNTKWEHLRVAKQKALDRIDERLGRIVEIQKELTKLALEEGCGEAPAPAPQHVPGYFYMWAPEEEMVALAEVKDDEVKVPKYVSPEELARRAAEAAAEAEARRLAEADDSRNRALKEMMNSSPAVTRKARGGGKNRLVREAWMDLPPGQMTKDQRLKLAEWERKRAEIAEELEKHRRLLEAERRALEVEIVETAAAVNTELTRLANAKVRMDMEIVHLERRAVDIADTAAALSAAEAARQALVAQLSAFTSRRSRRSPLLSALEQRVAAAQKAFDDIAFSEKQVDKAFRREFSTRPELWDDAQKVYKARAHLLQASPSAVSVGNDGVANGRFTGRLPTSKTPLELLGKSPEGQALAAVLEAPGLAEASVAQSIASSGGPGRQPTTTTRLASRVSAFDSLGGTSGGPVGPDVLLTTPRGVLRDMAHLARPQPRPGSPLRDVIRRYLEVDKRPGKAEVGDTDEGSSSGGGAAASPRAAGPLAPTKPRHGIAAVLDMAGDEASLARRGISQRPPGLRLRALAEKAGRLFEPLIQMVADGQPASALAAELGLLGLHLPANPLGNLDPYRPDGPGRLFNPEQTGAAEALGELGGAGGGGGSVGGSTAGGSISPVRERSSVSGGRASTANGSVGPSRAEEPPPAEPEDEEEDPLDSPERPEGMDDTLWIRLLEFRQTRADLELEAEEAWQRVSLLTAQLDWMEAEDAEMEAQVEEAGARAAALRDGAVRLSLDVYLAYRLKNGQVELPERPGDVVGAGDVLADAIILHRNRVEALNEEVLYRGEGKIEVLDTLRQTRRQIHLTQWETEAAEIAGQHAAQRLTELQLLHVTKDLQAALRDPTIVDRMNEEARLAVVWQSTANLHSHRLEQRKRQFATLAQRVSRSGAEQGELSVAEAAAEAAYQESTRMHLMLSYAKAVEDAGHRRHMRNIVSNAQLRAIAQQQTAELEKLAAQLKVSHSRNFPALAPVVAWMPPDYRPPRPGSPAAMSGAGGSRGGSRTGTAAGSGSRPASAALPLPGVQRGASSLPRSSTTSSGGGSRVGTPVPRGNSGLGTTRSGGAGATLTRAYAVAAHAAGGAAGVSSVSGGGGGTAAGAATMPSTAPGGAGGGRTLGDRRPASSMGGSPAPRPLPGVRPATTGGRRF